MRYLIVKHFYKGTYMTNDLTTKDLVALKNRDMEAIIDLENSTYFDAENNEWKEITKI